MRNVARFYFLQFKECKVNELEVEKLSEHTEQTRVSAPEPDSVEFVLEKCLQNLVWWFLSPAAVL